MSKAIMLAVQNTGSCKLPNAQAKSKSAQHKLTVQACTQTGAACVKIGARHNGGRGVESCIQSVIRSLAVAQTGRANRDFYLRILSFQK